MGAVGPDGIVADVSARGAPMARLTLTAPGVDIVSTSKREGYRIGTGTSPAAAIVAGAAALVWSRYPQLSNIEVADQLIRTAVDKGAPGRDDEYGYGELDLMNALETPPPPPSTTTSIEGNGLPPRANPPGATPAEGVAAEPAGADRRGSDDGGSNAAPLVGISAGVVVVGAGLAVVLRKKRRAGEITPF